MKMTYIGHSGVALEWENCNWVIDYYTGQMPEFDKEKKLFVFSSHAHGDLFNPKVFEIFIDYNDVEYLLSFDIQDKVDAGCGASQEQKANITYLEAGKTYEFKDGKGGEMSVRTFVSTDQGIAFLIKYAGKTVYHAGDLHWWAWPGNEPDYDKWMKDTYLGEVEKMKGESIDLAFLPVDGRIEQNIYMGADAFMRMVDVKNMYPIHMFGDFEATKRFRAEDISAPYRDRIRDIDRDGQEFDIDL